MQQYTCHSRVVASLVTQELGYCTKCHIKVVDSDRWPANKTDETKDLVHSSSSIFAQFVMQTLRGSFENEGWWIVGTCIQGIISNVIRPLLVMMLFDLAIEQQSLDWSFVVSTAIIQPETARA